MKRELSDENGKAVLVDAAEKQDKIRETAAGKRR